jgi:hypothetical protein
MSNDEPFVIPEGLIFEQTDGGLVIENKGDIVLHGTLGNSVHRIRSTRGNVVLHLDTVTDQIEAPRGSVIVHGSMEASSVTAEKIEIEGDVKAESLVAGDHGIVIKGDAIVQELLAKGDGIVIHGNVESTTIIADSGDTIIHGDAQAKTIAASKGNVILQGGGQANEVSATGLVECHGTVQVNQVNAGETAEFYDNVKASTVRAAIVKFASKDATVKVVQATTAITLGAGRIQSDILISPEIHVDASATGKITVVECHNEIGNNAVKGCLRLADLEEMFGSADKFLKERGIQPLDASANGKAPAAEQAPAAEAKVSKETKASAKVEEAEPALMDDTVDPELQRKMLETLSRITKCYDGSDTPPAVSRLESLVSTQAYGEIRTDITDIWNQLLKYHQSKGLRMQSQVTSTFHALNKIIRDM